MSRAGRIIKRITFIIVNILTDLWIAYLSLLSPFDYEWDENLKQIDEDACLVLSLLWRGVVFHVCVLMVLEGAVFKQKKIPVWIYYGCVAAYVCFKMIQIIWIDFKW